MQDIPIKFDYQERAYEGYFTRVSGAGATATWHLMIKEKRDGKVGTYYYGQLFYTESYGWQFGGDFKELADYFGGYITSWIDGKTTE